jgi:hypothetical protein
MASKIKTDLSVGIPEEMEAALENAVAFSGIKASQYARIALVEKLCREQFMQHPGLAQVRKPAIKSQPSPENMVPAE